MIASVIGSVIAGIAVVVILVKMFFKELREYYEKESCYKKWKI